MTMPAPAHTRPVIANIEVTSDTPALQSRLLRPGTDSQRLSSFGEDLWVLDPAIPDLHSAQTSIDWSIYPARLRMGTKLYVFALLNVVDEAPRLPFARSAFPLVKTVVADLPFLREFLRWLDTHEVTRFANVTSDHLNEYLLHVQQLPKTTAWQRRALLAVQRLHAYRDHLPEQCQLPQPPPFGAATAAQLVGDPGPTPTNRTPRICADVMEPLLSAALLTTTTIAGDIRTITKRLLAIRALAQHVATNERQQTARQFHRWPTLINHIERLIPAMIEHGLPLPGIYADGEVAVDVANFSVAAWVDRDTLLHSPVQNQLRDSGLVLKPDWLIIKRFGTVVNGPWRSQPLEAAELFPIVRHLITACFLVIAYLSGVRTGEALNLRRGCITHDKRLGLIFLSGERLKTTTDRGTRSTATTPWVVTKEVADAVAILEWLAPDVLLFPGGKFCSGVWYASGSTKPRTPGKINTDIREFVRWFNSDIAPITGHPSIPDDPEGDLAAPRLRRTLAWHIVHRPNGIIAGATQYGHVRTQITQGYAGLADAGFASDLEFEALLLRAEQLHEDAQLLRTGEHVSGPSAEHYRSRIEHRPQFVGTTITSAAQLRKLEQNPALDIHHGALLTCVYRHETAACRDHTDQIGPEWGRCRLSCANIAYTDRNIDAVRTEVDKLNDQAAGQLVPRPLRIRLAQRSQRLQQVIATHEI